MYRGALRSMLSELARQDRLLVTDGLALEAPKTKLLAAQLKSLALDNVLIIVEALDEKLFLAARNLPDVEVLTVAARQSAEPGRATTRCWRPSAP